MLTAGTLLALESGEYSDFGVIGFFRILKDFDGKEALNEYLKEFPDEAEHYHGSEYRFAEWLSKHGYIDDVDYLRWHVGAYGCFDRAGEPEKAVRL